jgi:hypothetical protein
VRLYQEVFLERRRKTSQVDSPTGEKSTNGEGGFLDQKLQKSTLWTAMDVLRGRASSKGNHHTAEFKLTAISYGDRRRKASEVGDFADENPRREGALQIEGGQRWNFHRRPPG